MHIFLTFASFIWRSIITYVPPVMYSELVQPHPLWSFWVLYCMITLNSVLVFSFWSGVSREIRQAHSVNSIVQVPHLQFSWKNLSDEPSYNQPHETVTCTTAHTTTATLDKVLFKLRFKSILGYMARTAAAAVGLVRPGHTTTSSATYPTFPSASWIVYSSSDQQVLTWPWEQE